MLDSSFTFISKKIDLFFQLTIVQRFKKKYPKVVAFLQDRLSAQNFFGLPFTTLLIVLFINLSILSELSEHIVNSNQMKMVDSAVTMFFYDNRIDFLNNSIYYFTQLGSTIGVAVILLISALFLYLKAPWQYIVALFISVLGSGVSIYFTKEYFHRERPSDFSFYELSTFSFPSGHATSAVALVGMLCIFVYHKRQKIRGSFWWVAVAILYIFMMGISRIYLGVHYLSDVIGGYLLGILWVIVAISALEYLLLKKQVAGKTNPSGS